MRCYLLFFLLLALARGGAAQNLVPYHKGNLWGYRTPAGRVVVAPRYQHAEAFAGGLAKVWQANKCGYLNAQGREVIPVRWDATSYHDTAAAWLQHRLPPWPEARQWVLVMQFDSLLTYPTGHWPAEPWQPGAHPLPSRYADKNTQHLGFYTPLGRVVLPAYYSNFQQLSPAYFAAAIAGERIDGGRYMDGAWRGIMTRFTTQLVHRSGRRLALGGRSFLHIRALYGDTLVVNGGSSGRLDGQYTCEVNSTAELIDTTGRRLVWQSAGTPPEQFRTLTPLRGSGGLWLAEYSDRYYTSRLRYCLLRPDGTPALKQDIAWRTQNIADIPLLAPGRALICTGVEKGSLYYGVLAVPSCEWLIQPQFGSIEPVDKQGFVVKQAARTGAIRADGRPWIPLHYTRLAPCRTRSGQLLPYWYAEASDQAWLLSSSGRKLLSLGAHYAHHIGYHTQEFSDDLTLVIDKWNDRRAAVIQLAPAGQPPAATLQLRPRAAQ